MRTRVRVALALTSVLLAAVASAAQERSEQELVDLVVRDGPRARAIRAAADVVAHEQAARLAMANPSASYTREGAGFTEFLQVEQALPAFGLRAALRRAGVAARAAADAERDALLWQLRIEAHAAIARLRAETERLQRADRAVRLVEDLVAVLSTREREGEASRFDRLRAEQEVVDARQVVVERAIALSEARNALAALLPVGVSVPETIGPPSATATPETVAALLARAETGRAELRALRSLAERFSIEGDAARRAQGPAPVINGGLKRADAGLSTDAGAVVGVSLNLPLFNSGAREAARWQAERLRVEAERAAVEADIRAQITQADRVLTLREQSHRAAAQALASSDDLMSIADVAYREGDIGILGLLDAYRTAARAQQRAADANLDLRLAQIALERAVGVTLWP